MSFPLDKIITISAQEYVGPGVAVKDKYEFQGIHLSKLFLSDYVNLIENAVHSFAKLIPLNAEVVVGYQSISSATGRADDKVFFTQMSGTALIPKKE